MTHPPQAPHSSHLPLPPVADVEPRTTRRHGDERVDPYHWLCRRDDPRVTAYLEAENRYTEAVMAPLAPLVEELFGEIVGRIRQTDETVPERRGGYLYYSRTVEGLQYRIHCRRRASPDGEEEVILDLNERAHSHEFLALGMLTPDDDQHRLAATIDVAGDELFTLEVKDLRTGAVVDTLESVARPVAWGSGDELWYLVRDDTKRPYQVWRHRVGRPRSEDELIFQEDDEAFFVDVRRTRSRRFLEISSHSIVTSEVRLLEVGRGAGPPPGGSGRREEPWVVCPRRDHVKYDVDHHVDHRGDHRGDHLYLRTNDGAKSFRLLRASVAAVREAGGCGPEHEAWETVIAHRPAVLLESCRLFRDHAVLVERHEGLRRLRILDLGTDETRVVAFTEPAYGLRSGANPDFDTPTFRFFTSTLTAPESTWDVELRTGQRTLRKRQEVMGGHDPEDYVCERLWVPAADGARVPVSLAWRRGASGEDRLDRPRPCLLYGYGAYGINIDPTFRSSRLSLLDRGFVYALAHVRGSSTLGEEWHDQGKLLAKRNTFTDTIAVAEHLISAGYTCADRLVLAGGSAGGLLVGAVLNRRPDLFAAALAHVPFVDVLDTMLDPSLPLTVIEYEEWGDPQQEEPYRYIRTYSPYDNVGAHDYPHLLITAGLNDPRVAYWEPAKWTAKLRALKTDGHRLLLRTHMGAGHSGPSGRYEAMREMAFEWAFLLDVLGLAEPR